MRRVGLGIFLLLLSIGLLQGADMKRAVVGFHSVLLVPSLNRIEESDVMSEWAYDVGWGVDATFNITNTFAVNLQYDFFPVRYHGLADRSDVQRIDISGNNGLIHHFSGELTYSIFHFNHSRLFFGGSYDYFTVDQTVNGSYLEQGQEVSYTDTATLDKGTFGIPIGISSDLGDKIGFSFRVKPILYWWNDESTLQFITTMASISVGYAF